jgi:hypothetical protein
MAPFDVDQPRDIGAVGANARAGKAASPKELTDFSVKRGDNGGCIICETRRAKAPEGRRFGAAYPMGQSDYTENPYGPTDGAAAARYVTALLGEMGLSGASPAAPPLGPPRPPVTAARTPMGSAVRTPTAGAVRGPFGGAAAIGPGAGTDEY